jgi:HSP20 family protein
MSTLTRHLNPIRNMFLLDNQDYDPFKDFFNNFSKALSDDHRLTDIKDNGDVYTVSIELPGYKKGDVKAEVNDGVLTVTAEKDGKTSYQNSFSIKSDVDTKSITANLEYGILTLTLPKKEVSKPRKIKVQ